MNKELRTGIKIEMEHKPTLNFIKSHLKKYGKMPSDKLVFMNIAKNHLTEDPRYYTHLVQMEKKHNR